MDGKILKFNKRVNLILNLNRNKKMLESAVYSLLLQFT
jgi:hypothetical protein